MYIKNQTFKDEDTLLEMLFDFALGDPTPIMKEMIDLIDGQLIANAEFQQHLQTLEEEDRLELYNDVQQENVARLLMQLYTSFKVRDAHLYGVKGNEEELLYKVELH